MTADDRDQLDLLSDFSDLDFVRHLLTDLHDALPGKVARFRMLTDLGRDISPHGTMIWGSHATHHARVESRSSFVQGNFAATVLLCQGLVEHLLAAYLYGALLMEDLPDRIQFQETLRRCHERGVISEQDITDLKRLMALRNPLSHFRHVHDAWQNPLSGLAEVTSRFCHIKHQITTACRCRSHSASIASANSSNCIPFACLPSKIAS